MGKIFALIYINFNFDFLAFKKVYFENNFNFANQLGRSSSTLAFISTLKDSQFDILSDSKHSRSALVLKSDKGVLLVF